MIDWGGKVAAWFFGAGALAISIAVYLGSAAQPWRGWRHDLVDTLFCVAAACMVGCLLTGPAAIVSTVRRNRLKKAERTQQVTATDSDHAELVRDNYEVKPQDNARTAEAPIIPLTMVLIDEEWTLVEESLWVFAILVQIENKTNKTILVTDFHFTDLDDGDRNTPLHQRYPDIWPQVRREAESLFRAHLDDGHSGIFESYLLFDPNRPEALWYIGEAPPPEGGGRPRFTFTITDSLGNSYDMEIDRRPFRRFRMKSDTDPKGLPAIRLCPASKEQGKHGSRRADPPAQRYRRRRLRYGGIVTSSGILSFLADRFNVRSREEFATEGLGYLLQEYPVVRDIVVNALSTSCLVAEIRSDIAFVGQARSADDSWVVDLEGRIDERIYISVEGKLDATLQPSQPVEYVKRLQDGGSLVFVCPTGRISRLQKELERRAGAASMLELNASWGLHGAAGVSWIPLTKRRQLGITSWTSLLKLISDGSGGASRAIQSDVYQLERLVARYELELEAWTPEELRNGSLGPTFGKALVAARMLCGIISTQMGASITPAWTVTASNVHTSRDFYDWYGGKVSLPPPAGGLLAVSFDPLLWGQDQAHTPLRLSFLTRKLPGAAIDLMYPVYLRMIEWANESLGNIDAGSAAANDRAQDWWVVPFPIRAGLAGDEARGDMATSAAHLLRPLLNLMGR